ASGDPPLGPPAGPHRSWRARPPTGYASHWRFAGHGPTRSAFFFRNRAKTQTRSAPMKLTHVVLVLVLSGLPAVAQEVHHVCPKMTGSTHAQAAMNESGVSDEQRREYLNGEGIGLAKAAELNHYPGPRHVLDIADKLGLSTDQLTATRALFDDVH